MKFSIRTLNWMIISYFIVLLLFSTVIFNASIRLNKIKMFGIRSDYLLHALLFIPWLILARWRWDHSENNKSIFWLTLGVGFLLTGFSEGLQYLMPYRSISKNDLLANMAGLAIGALISLRWKIQISRQYV